MTNTGAVVLRRWIWIGFAVLFVAAAGIVGWLLVRESACSTMKLLPDHDGPCIEFWLNRYQTLLIGVVGTIAAIYAALSAWQSVQHQLNYKDTQARLVVSTAFRSEIPRMEHYLQTVRALASSPDDYLQNIGTLSQRKPDGYKDFVAEILMHSEGCYPLTMHNIRYAVRNLTDFNQEIANIVTRYYQALPVSKDDLAKLCKKLEANIANLRLFVSGKVFE